MTRAHVTAQLQHEIGTDFVGYRIEALIGRGAMGVVYRAYDLRLKRTVALKLVAPELALDARFRTRFIRETELAMALEHPNVVPIYDAGDVDSRLYLAMRLVDGSDLRTLLRSDGPLEPARAFVLCSQVGAALDAAHAKGLVHCDVKPSNVLLDQNEHVYVADLGLSQRLEDQRPGDESTMGTPAYLAPEHIEGLQIDGRADVYSLGCLLYECLTGELPFTGDSRLALAWAHLEEEPPRASEHNPKLPGAIDSVLAKALAKEPAQRYQSCAALLSDAQQALGLGRPAGLRRRRWLLLAAALVTLATAAAVAAVVVSRDSGAAPPKLRPNALVRLDPTTYKVTDVVPVQDFPYAIEFGGGVLWVYSHGSTTLSEVDAADAVVRRTVRLRTVSQVTLPNGPWLAADNDGAWVVGSEISSGRGFLTHVRRGGGNKYVYPLPVDPTAVALGEDAVWVVGSSKRVNELLRIDADTGRITGRRSFPRKVESVTAGLDAVWVVASVPGVLYRVNPRSLRVTGSVELGRNAVRPAVIDERIWVGIGSGGSTAVVSAETLGVAYLSCCLPSEGSDATGFGSDWMTSWPTGTLVRWDLSTKDIARSIQLVDPPRWGGPCLASVATGAGAVWVTVAPDTLDACPSLG